MMDPRTEEELFVWILHRFSEKFENHMILKGGMELRLLESQRYTNDLDFVFVPFESKKEIASKIISLLKEIPGAIISHQMNSKALRIQIRKNVVAIQIEVNVAKHCPSTPVATGALASQVGEQPRIIQVMSYDVALAHKLAAWNERRLIRDLYDAYFLMTRVGAAPDTEILRERLRKIQSRIPKLKNKKKMTLLEFLNELEASLLELDQSLLDQELEPLLSLTERAGLAVRIRSRLLSWISEIRVRFN
jgi:predicted nucleotidyltransferase component of viral defense system